MVVFDIFVTQENQAIGLANKGHIYSWDINKILAQQFDTNMSDSLSVYKYSNHLTLSNDTYYSIVQLNESLVAIQSAQSIKICQLSKLCEKSQAKKIEDLEIRSEEFESKFNDYFTVSVPFNKSKLLIGTGSGKILLYDTSKQVLENQIVLNSSSQKLSQDYKKSSISSMSLLNQSLILGTKGGTINQLDLRTFKSYGQFSLKDQELPGITKIITDDRSIYVGHDEYVTRWDRSRLYTGSYNIGFECSALLKRDNDELVVGGNVPEIYRIQDKNVKKWQSSSKCILGLKEKNGLVYACGVSNLIDIFNNTTRVCSLAIF